jgi:hypothetical protein
MSSHARFGELIVQWCLFWVGYVINFEVLYKIGYGDHVCTYLLYHSYMVYHDTCGVLVGLLPSVID